VSSQNSILLVCAIVAAALFAAFRREPTRSVAAVDDVREQASPVEAPGDVGEDEALPANHPPITGTSTPPVERPSEGAASLVWKVPAKWTVAPNASTMRLATYRVPPAGASEAAELTVVRAGGSTDANLQRWVEQFTDAEPARRTKQTVRGFAVSLLEVSGTFTAGAMGQTPAGPRRDWMLLGAVVETPEGAYFFKLTGPRASVRAARSDFDALVKSLAPAKSAEAP
jgi:hypothetical protein